MKCHWLWTQEDTNNLIDQGSSIDFCAILLPSFLGPENRQTTRKRVPTSTGLTSLFDLPSKDPPPPSPTYTFHFPRFPFKPRSILPSTGLQSDSLIHSNLG
ncbi:hypothetical protein E1B28_007964 [Marasmius oreades]|uniref:Uncharacterized protein n=1 Tax=Marasmius oreades TaxID=181124 RepID=A0A9P7S4J7_9AGAR|nr:uncharacterized protein E1B28_007964 [Marasmius oreades]KAG7094363.1 hypothetical protein E1B28_007964 [Marasmius oreades]